MELLAAFACGITIVISRTTNAQLGKSIRISASTFYNYLTGSVVALLFLLLSKETLPALSLPKTWSGTLMYLGGIVGVLSVSLSNYVTPRISAFQLTIILFISQIFTGLLIDWLRYNTLSIGKLIGGILIIFGLVYNTYIDSKQMNESNLNI
ncbi:DMT family transporter [Anaerosporobacter faecicola]|uniref:DMT family transporter n=1 Tax=Anaerosporobacter faecicola TaxID=2718714 RepID=UPI00143A7546|nr:DMT family transporter [Anaerosporobacter faecicola]